MAIEIDILTKLGLLLFCVSCTQQEVISPPDRLVFVEGKELTAGRFGDLVMLGPEIVGKQVLTRDSYYDARPIFMDSSKIVFLSARRKDDKRLGLSKADDLYLYDQGSIQLLFNWAEKSILDFYHFDDVNNIILYKNIRLEPDDIKYEIVQQNIADSADRKILYDRADAVNNVKVSGDLHYLLLEKTLYNGVLVAGRLFLYNLLEDYEKDILAGVTDIELGLLTENNCSVGSFISDTEFLFTCLKFREQISVIYTYDLLTDSVGELFRTNELYVTHPISNYRSSKVYFLARPFDSDDVYENIWMINKYGAPGDSAVQLTNTRLNKDWLQIEN